VSAPPFLADENIPAPVVAELRRCGFDVQSVAEDQPGANWKKPPQRRLRPRDGPGCPARRSPADPSRSRAI